MSPQELIIKPVPIPIPTIVWLQVQEGRGLLLDGGGGGPLEGPAAVGGAEAGREALHKARARLLRRQRRHRNREPRITLYPSFNSASPASPHVYVLVYVLI